MTCDLVNVRNLLGTIILDPGNIVNLQFPILSVILEILEHEVPIILRLEICLLTLFGIASFVEPCSWKGAFETINFQVFGPNLVPDGKRVSKCCVDWRS